MRKQWWNRMLGDVADWLWRSMQLTQQRGRTHLLRSPGRSLLQSPLENLAQILDTEARISARGQRGDREQHRPRQNQSKHQPTTTSTGHVYIYNRENQQRAWNMTKERERLKSEKYTHFRLPFAQNSL